MLWMLLATALMAAQTQQLPKAHPETGVELIAVDVHVVDQSGKPIADLRSEDFDVEISGRRHRVLAETSGHYLLGIEAADADRDGQTHAIRVRVKRGGAQVRSRTFVAIAPVKAKGPVEQAPGPPVAASPAMPPPVDPVRMPLEPGGPRVDRNTAAGVRRSP